MCRVANNCARFHFNDPDYVSFGPITSIGCFERYVEHREEFGWGVGKVKRGMRSISSMRIASIRAMELVDNHLGHLQKLSFEESSITVSK